MEQIKEKILALIKMANPEDPVSYVRDIIKPYALEKVNSDISACNKCGLCNFGIKTNAYGDINSKILMVGESVSSEQYSQGNRITLPMLDTDGETLTRAMGVINANRQAIYLVNIVNCYPANAKGDSITRRIPVTKERDACKTHLDRIIDIMNPSVIIALGAVSANAMSPNKISIIESRGQMFEYKGYPVMPTFHPGFFREMSDRYDDEIMNMYKDNFLSDLYHAFMIAKDADPNCKIGDITLPI